MPGKRIDDLTDLTVQGIWEAHLNGELAEADVVDRASVHAAGVLAEKGLLVPSPALHLESVEKAATRDWRIAALRASMSLVGIGGAFALCGLLFGAI